MRCTWFISASVALTSAVTADAAAVQQRATACAPQPVGAGPNPSPDSVSAFLALPAFSDAATTAATPQGYVKQFSNLQAAVTLPSGFISAESVKTYDVAYCASRCNAIRGCDSFNLYFERGPSLEPGSGNSGCANPRSTTNIKCAYWRGAVTSGNAVNKGQYRNQFQVVIAGSNGYTNASLLVNQARGEILGNSGQPYCSSILGYTTPVETTTVLATSTVPLVSTTIATNTISQATTQIDVTIVTVTEVTQATTVLTQPTTTTATSTEFSRSTLVVPTTVLESTKTIVSTAILEFPTTTTIMLTMTVAAPFKRDVSLPSALSKYPSSIVTSACFLAVSPGTTASTVTSTRTTVISSVISTSTSFATTSEISTEITSTTANPITLITSTSTIIEVPTITNFATIVQTDTIVEQTTTTLTSTISETATSSVTPIVTATTIQTIISAAPACTPTANVFQVVGGNRDGQYLRNNGVSEYGAVFPGPLISEAQRYSLRPDGRVFGPTTTYGWTAGKDDGYDIIAKSETQVKSSGGYYAFLYCSVQPSSLVATVAKATGALVCRRGAADGPVIDLLIYKDASLNKNVAQSVGTYDNKIISFDKFMPLTLAVIPVGPNC